MFVAEILIAIAVLVLLYAWVAYPAAAAAAARNAGRAAPGARPETTEPPSVAVLFSAHNEEHVIARRLDNLAELRIADCELRIFAGLDGCADATSEIAGRFAREHSNARVAEFPERRGKAAVLKDLVKEVLNSESSAAAERREQILVFTDANTRFMPGALSRLLAPFADARVGGVCGRLVLGSAERGVRPENCRVQGSLLRSDSYGGLAQGSGFGDGEEGLYWSLENRLKEMESRVDSCLGANGAIYAVRAALFPLDIPDNTVVEDFVIGMKVREQGFRVAYEPDAVAEEELPETEAEWGRRVRIGAGDYQAMWLCRKCLLPRYGRFAWMFWSHKVLRWFTPHILLLSVLGSWFSVVWAGLSWSNVPSALVCGLSALLFACALAGRILRGSKSRAAVVFRLCDHFLTMQTALFAGFLSFCAGGLSGHWQRTPRK